MHSTVLSKEQTRDKVRELCAGAVAQKYPQLHPRERARLAKKLARKVLSENPGAHIEIRRKPASRWQALKARVAPQWFLARYPVALVEY